MELKDIKAIIDLMKKNSITEFELEKEEFKIKLKRGTQARVVSEQAVVEAPAPAAPSAAAVKSVAAPSNEADIKSPMIGTFYRSPSPEAGSYVEVGSEVGPDTVVCIIEAMKVMNEIKAEARGVITKILVDNSKPVEFGQALFKIKPL
ncbi:MAG: acetyl-CoA carboxylase biotin carboxyl carrier protein [Verrucomicrobiae bacterium]|nr:acetyl-CoA carboxylase biotin carboxyl carrier protein [Verrucomicrobiae bacterium]